MSSGYGFLVVARYHEGKVLGGTTADFRPDRSYFTVVEDGAGTVRVALDELKALFFVKTLIGDHRHQETKSFRYRQEVGKKVWVVFKDGEELAGWTVSFGPERNGFFLFPTDANSNIEKVFIVQSSLDKVLLDAAAEQAATDYENRAQDRSAPRITPDAWDEMLGLRKSRADRDWDDLGPAKSPAEEPRKRPDSGIFLQDF